MDPHKPRPALPAATETPAPVIHVGVDACTHWGYNLEVGRGAPGTARRDLHFAASMGPKLQADPALYTTKPLPTGFLRQIVFKTSKRG